mmetsp:Transcript_2915/g.6301  ORF Transcript_2915/g.6301 Transcript_2915/m.6301 type:complete len:253 (+) Transcript_2915:882-1640(+)
MNDDNVRATAMEEDSAVVMMTTWYLLSVSFIRLIGIYALSLVSCIAVLGSRGGSDSFWGLVVDSGSSNELGSTKATYKSPWGLVVSIFSLYNVNDGLALSFQMGVSVVDLIESVYDLTRHFDRFWHVLSLSRGWWSRWWLQRSRNPSRCYWAIRFSISSKFLKELLKRPWRMRASTVYMFYVSSMQPAMALCKDGTSDLSKCPPTDPPASSSSRPTFWTAGSLTLLWMNSHNGVVGLMMTMCVSCFGFAIML